MTAEDEYVFVFERFDFKVMDEKRLLDSAKRLKFEGAPPRKGYSVPRILESNADAVDMHIALWGHDRLADIPGVRLVARSGRTMSYDFDEAGVEESREDPFLWGTNDDDDDLF